MQLEPDQLVQRMELLSEMQKELKEMQVVLQRRQDDLEMQQEELRQYQSQVLRTLATFRALLEQEQERNEKE